MKRSIDERKASFENNLTSTLTNLLILDFNPFLQEKYKISLLRKLQSQRRKLAKESNKKAPILNLSKIYKVASLDAAKEIARRPKVMPQKCPYALEQIFDVEFIPVAKALPFKRWQPKNGAEIASDASESGFHYTKISQGATGLPMCIWILERTISSQVCAIAVSRQHYIPKKSDISSAVLVSVCKNPKVLYGESLSKADWRQVQRFIQKNIKTIHRHWNYKTDSIELFNELVNVDGRWIVERGRVGKFYSGQDRMELWVWKDYYDKSTFRLKNIAKGYEVDLYVGNLRHRTWIQNPRELKKVPRKDLAAVLEFFKSKVRDNSSLTGWQAFCLLWSSINYERKLATRLLTTKALSE